MSNLLENLEKAVEGNLYEYERTRERYLTDAIWLHRKEILCQNLTKDEPSRINLGVLDLSSFKRITEKDLTPEEIEAYNKYKRPLEQSQPKSTNSPYACDVVLKPGELSGNYQED